MSSRMEGGPEETRGPEANASEAVELSFEEALARLEALVGRLEAGDLPLEETIAAFEEGQALLKTCGDLLSRAELRVKEVLRRADGSLEESDWGGDVEGPGA